MDKALKNLCIALHRASTNIAVMVVVIHTVLSHYGAALWVQLLGIFLVGWGGNFLFRFVMTKGAE